jgi:hypothetical protein
MRRVHAASTVVWLVLAVPSMLWWNSSIPYVVFLSVYAIVASHWSAWQASRAEETADGATPGQPGR